MKANTPSGFRDLLPKEARQKEQIIQKIISVYRQYGFVPLETPIVEFKSTLVGDVTDFNLFLVHPSKERLRGSAKEMAMRFDLTVPLARTIAQHTHIAKPFKRYQLGDVFRGERPQKGRYRQFTQLDADIVGSKSIYSDIEIILMMHSVMSKLDVGNFTIRVNTRKILNALPEFIGFDENKLRSILIILDKRDKVSENELAIMLKDNGLSDKQITDLVGFGSLSGDMFDVLGKLEDLFKNIKSAQEALSDLRKISESISFSNKFGSNIIFDMSVIRGLSYYTGTVFETVLDDYPQYGSIYSGGRYDNLIEKLGGSSISAVGASVGVDRLLAILTEIGSGDLTQQNGYALLVHSEGALDYAIQVAEEIRSLSLMADVYTGSGKIGKQFSYAESKGYTKVIILGENEKRDRSLLIKDLITKEQKIISFKNIKQLKI